MMEILRNDCCLCSSRAPSGQRSGQPLNEHLVCVLPRDARWGVHRCRSAREPRRRRRLSDAIADEKGVAGCQLRMARRIGHAEYGCHAGVAVAEDLCPVLLRAGGEGGADLGSQLRPRLSVILRGGIRRALSCWVSVGDRERSVGEDRNGVV
jgi:hypothetical protein